MASARRWFQEPPSRVKLNMQPLLNAPIHLQENLCNSHAMSPADTDRLLPEDSATAMYQASFIPDLQLLQRPAGYAQLFNHACGSRAACHPALPQPPHDMGPGEWESTAGMMQSLMARQHTTSSSRRDQLSPGADQTSAAAVSRKFQAIEASTPVVPGGPSYKRQSEHINDVRPLCHVQAMP